MPRDRRAEDRDEYIIADHGRRIGRLEKRPIGGGFDPNEEPVIIGQSATAGGGSTPDNVSAGHAFGVVVGRGCTVSADGGTAIGNGSTVTLDNSTAIGAASVESINGVAIGPSTAVLPSSDGGVAIGYQADVGFGTAAANGVAVGAHSSSVASSAVAIGHSATANGTNGVAIGLNALATGVDSVAIGHQPQLLGARQVAIGQFAGGGGVCDDGTSVGANAVVDNASTGASSFGANAGARGDSTTALGYNADTGFRAHCTALGADSACTAPNQVMLGSDQDFTEIPGDSSVVPNGLVLTDTDGSGNRWIIQATSGALALSVAP